MDTYSRADVRRGYAWLGHQGSYTELTILHPEYRADDPERNREHKAWPITQYVSSVAGVEDLVRQYAGERFVCYGINPRPAILTKPDGRLRSATEADIGVSQNVLLDLDLEGTVTPERLDALKAFLARADEYFTALGCRRPVLAATGRGSHLLFAYQPIPVATCPDLRERLRAFRDQFCRAVQQDLTRLAARVDRTQDLRRVTRVYGTSKPGVASISRFYGRERNEDEALREHLLRLDVSTTVAPVPPPPLTVSDALPDWFTSLLATDDRLRALWQGEGKPAGMDQATSGYDYSLVRYLIRHGHQDPDQLGTILSLRPAGSVRRHQKSTEYVARRVQQALSRSSR
jgi:hypothetical protein